MVEKVTWTQKALCDLRDIFDYISKDSPHFAELVTQQILGKAGLIKSSPYMGRVVPEFNNPELREIIFKSYRIIYKLSGSEISIIRIYHASRTLS
jgi:addiction module RelE/StbE family toxin